MYHLRTFTMLLPCAFLLALGVPPALEGQSMDTLVRWAPQDPSQHDPVVVSISGMWFEGCVPEYPSAVFRDPPADAFPDLFSEPDPPGPIAARWAVVLTTVGDHACPPVTEPYDVSVALGPLPPGFHRVLFEYRDHRPGASPHPGGTLAVADFFVGSEPAEVLSLHEGRFEVSVTWRTPQGDEGVGVRVPGASESAGLFSFFDPDNWEVLVKVLDGCSYNDRYWVLMAAATNVEYTLRIEDLATETVWERTNPMGRLSPAHADIRAFAGCPAVQGTQSTPMHFGVADHEKAQESAKES
jgi:hypothetical protein